MMKFFQKMKTLRETYKSKNRKNDRRNCMFNVKRKNDVYHDYSEKYQNCRKENEFRQNFLEVKDQ